MDGKRRESDAAPQLVAHRTNRTDALHEALGLMQRGVRLVVPTRHPGKSLEREEGLSLLVDEPLLSRDFQGARQLYAGLSRSPCCISAEAVTRAMGAPRGDESSARSRLASASSESARAASPLPVMESARWIQASTASPTSPIERASSRSLVRSVTAVAGSPAANGQSRQLNLAEDCGVDVFGRAQCVSRISQHHVGLGVLASTDQHLAEIGGREGRLGDVPHALELLPRTFVQPCSFIPLTLRIGLYAEIHLHQRRRPGRAEAPEHLQSPLLVHGLLGLTDGQVGTFEGRIGPSERVARAERFRVRNDLRRDRDGFAGTALLQMDVRPAGQEAAGSMLGFDGADGLDPLQPRGDLPQCGAVRA